MNQRKKHFLRNKVYIKNSMIITVFAPANKANNNIVVFKARHVDNILMHIFLTCVDSVVACSSTGHSCVLHGVSTKFYPLFC